MTEFAVYPTWYDKIRAEICMRHPWMNLKYRYTYVDLEYECPDWIYPVVYGPEEYV